LSFRRLLSLLLLDQMRAHALRRFSRLRGVLPSCLLCTLAGRRRLLCACGAFELPQQLRRLMVTMADADLERSVSAGSLCIYLRAELHQQLDRLNVALECRLM
jgi:hypothetical protein